MVETQALQFHRFDRLDSTNTTAKALATTGAPHGTVVISGEQTGGRGRLGRSFFSPGGTGIYLSMIIRPEVIGMTNDSAILLTTAASVAVAQAVKKTLGLNLQIKWVNDLYFNERKICGILAEGVIDPKRGCLEAIILGIGLNYKEPPGGFPEALRDIAGALIGSAVPSKTMAPDLMPTPLPTADELATVIAEELWAMLPDVTDRSFLAEYKERSMVLGKQVRIFPKGSDYGPEPPSGTIVTALDIDNHGGLVIRHGDGSTETLTTGEISLRIV